MNKENCALKLVDEIIVYYDARSKKTSKKVDIVFRCCASKFLSSSFIPKVFTLSTQTWLQNSSAVYVDVSSFGDLTRYWAERRA